MRISRSYDVTAPACDGQFEGVSQSSCSSGVAPAATSIKVLRAIQRGLTLEFNLMYSPGLDPLFPVLRSGWFPGIGEEILLALVVRMRHAMPMGVGVQSARLATCVHAQPHLLAMSMLTPPRDPGVSYMYLLAVVRSWLVLC